MSSQRFRRSSGPPASPWHREADILDRATTTGNAGWWRALPPPWQRVLDLAWASRRAGSIAVGAVVVTKDGEMVGSGRNMIAETCVPPGDTPSHILGTPLAHAELNALLGLRRSPNGLCIYTSLQPCVLCSAAIAVAGLDSIAYLGMDAFDPGTEILTGPHRHVTWRSIQIESWQDTPLGVAAELLAIESHLVNIRAEPVEVRYRSQKPLLLASVDDIVQNRIIASAADQGRHVNEVMDPLLAYARAYLAEDVRPAAPEH